jgi:BCCT family betaine/carnitine transporter
MSEQGGSEAVVVMLEQLPAAGIIVAVYALIALIFSATTYDSASYILASAATRQLPAGDDPERWHRVFWALALAVLPITLMFVGGLKVVQSATLVVSLPLIFIGGLMSVSLVKQLKKDFG